MAIEEKKRSYESATLILPALKMVLIEYNETIANSKTAKNAKKKVVKDCNEETVLRIIDKLSMKD